MDLLAERRLTEELDRLQNHFAPDNWRGQREEIETAFGDVLNRIEENQRVERSDYARFFDERVLWEKTKDIIEPLREIATSGPTREDQFAAQEAINQAKDAAQREIAADPRHQEQRSLAVSELAREQAEILERIHNREGQVLQANGFRPMMEPVNNNRQTLDDLVKAKQRDRDNENER